MVFSWGEALLGEGGMDWGTGEYSGGCEGGVWILLGTSDRALKGSGTLWGSWGGTEACLRVARLVRGISNEILL